MSSISPSSLSPVHNLWPRQASVICKVSSPRKPSTARTCKLSLSIAAMSSSAPATRFSSAKDGNRSSPDVYVSSIDWARVVVFEPNCVAAWVKYLHQENFRAANTEVLHASLNFVVTRAADLTRSSQWDAFLRTGLPITLMEIICERGHTVFSSNGTNRVRCRPPSRSCHSNTDVVHV